MSERSMDNPTLVGTSDHGYYFSRDQKIRR